MLQKCHTFAEPLGASLAGGEWFGGAIPLIDRPTRPESQKNRPSVEFGGLTAVLPAGCALRWPGL